jgi:hypothetical protein
MSAQLCLPPLSDQELAAIRAAVQCTGRDCPDHDGLYRALGEAEAHREMLLAEVERLRRLLL